jgi:crotonobetainyl-CoA:carnitine CoA-transferase CaiB-like acyl-CoA transferase
VEELDHPLVGRYRQATHPVKFGEMPARIRRHAPALGANTEEILGEFDVTLG